MTTEERRALLDRAITAYGAPAQIDMAVEEMAELTKALCKIKRAQVVWIKTPAGKAMPCDPAPVYYKAAPGGKDKIVTTRGEVVSCEIVPGGEATDAGYRPHWATCPQAGQFKRGGRARE